MKLQSKLAYRRTLIVQSNPITSSATKIGAHNITDAITLQSHAALLAPNFPAYLDAAFRPDPGPFRMPCAI